jgi:hypothetical protein
MMTTKNLTHTFINWVTLGNLRWWYRIWKRYNRSANARNWANHELRKFAPLFSGEVINVSAGMDRDKEQGTYREYFSQARSYCISNYKRVFSEPSPYNEFELDLSDPLPLGSPLLGKFAIVISHTVLEHIYEVNVAIDNLCKLSNDIVITIVPWIQAFHHEEHVYHDYWRISPYALVRLFQERAYKTLYISWNHDPIGNIYIFQIASQHPERWDQIKLPVDFYGPGYERQLLLSALQECPNGRVNTLPGIIRPC